MAGDIQKRVSVVLEPSVKGAGGGGGGGIGAILQNLVSPGNKNGLLAGIMSNAMGGGGSMGGITGKAGAMIGEALGGPLGAIIGEKVGDVVGKMLDAIMHPVETFKKLAAEIAGYVQAANPQAVERFNMAMKDTTAILGHGLTPAMDMMTDVVRSIADAFASSNVMKELQGLGTELGNIFEELKPTIMLAARALGDFLGTVVGFTTVVLKLARMVGTFSFVPKSWTKGLNIEGASVGLAAHPANFSGVEEFGKQAALATAGSGKGPAQETADNTERTADLMEILVNMMTGKDMLELAKRGILGY